MNNVEIVKKRLKDLKSLSESLKKTSQSKQLREENINIVRTIMNLTKDIQGNSQQFQHQQGYDPHHEQDTNRQQSQQYHTSRLQKQQNKGHEKQYLNYNQAINLHNQIDKPNKENLNIRKFTPKHQQQLKQTKNAYQNLIKQLQLQRQHRIEVQNKNKKLVAKLQEMEYKLMQIGKTNKRSDQRVSKNLQNLSLQQQIFPSYKHLSYFNLSDHVGIFLTKLTIPEKDYNKLQYGFGQIKLNLNTIQVKLFSKYRESLKNLKSGKQKDKQKTSEDNIYQAKVTKLDLVDLFKVGYWESQVLVLKFSEENDERHLFIKFNDYQHRRKWDIGLYINFIILKSLNKDKMFVDDSLIDNLMRPESDKKNNQDQQESQNAEGIEMDRKVAEKIKIILGKVSLNAQEQQIAQSFYRQKQKWQQIMSKVKQSGLSKKLNFDAETQNNNLRKMFSKGNKSQQFQVASRMRKQQIQTFKNSQNNLKQVNNKEIKKYQNQQLNKKLAQNQQRRKQQLKQKQQIEKLEKKKSEIALAKSSLKKGMFMIKYAEGAFNPHDKRVFLSQDQTKLCWQDLGQKQKQYKFINVNDIVDANQGQIGPGIKKHVQLKDRLNNKCYLLIKLKDENRKQLEFGMKSTQLMQAFSQNLKIFLKTLQNQIDK